MASTKLKNPHLDQMTTDYLYHLNIAVDDTKNSINLQKQFGDVKVSYKRILFFIGSS